MVRRPAFIVTCMLVMGCGNLANCRLAERLLVQRGFQSRSTTEGQGHCTRALDRDHYAGSADGLLDEVCREIELAVSPNVKEWRVFVQVVGEVSAWATLEAGKPTLRGTLTPRHVV